MSTAGSLTGVFGGTFNPIHLGHLRAAEEVCERLALERILFVPSADPPLKRGGEEIAPAQDRLEWARIATKDNPRFAVDPIELTRQGPSYSVDTLRLLGERLAPERPVFVIGHDAFADLAAWREPEQLLALAHFAVVARPPARGGSLAEWLPPPYRGAFALEPDGQRGRHRTAGTWIQRIAIAGLEVSSTEIRRRLREGRSVRYLVPEGILAALTACPAYGARRAR